ncbi:hypothetical protein C8J56DRAFT_901897 [Mycena floridula]|nr:hypothetical protein C8J56DRAFT_901897 [Mycena floridula]
MEWFLSYHTNKLPLSQYSKQASSPTLSISTDAGRFHQKSKQANIAIPKYQRFLSPTLFGILAIQVQHHELSPTSDLRLFDGFGPSRGTNPLPSGLILPFQSRSVVLFPIIFLNTDFSPTLALCARLPKPTKYRLSSSQRIIDIPSPLFMLCAAHTSCELSTVTPTVNHYLIGLVFVRGYHSSLYHFIGLSVLYYHSFKDNDAVYCSNVTRRRHGRQSCQITWRKRKATKPIRTASDLDDSDFSSDSEPASTSDVGPITNEELADMLPSKTVPVKLEEAGVNVGSASFSSIRSKMVLSVICEHILKRFTSSTWSSNIVIHETPFDAVAKASGIRETFSQDKFEHILIQWLVACDQPFKEVERPKFVDMLQAAYSQREGVKLCDMKLGNETIAGAGGKEYSGSSLTSLASSPSMLSCLFWPVLQALVMPLSRCGSKKQKLDQEARPIEGGRREVVDVGSEEPCLYDGVSTEEGEDLVLSSRFQTGAKIELDVTILVNVGLVRIRTAQTRSPFICASSFHISAKPEQPRAAPSDTLAWEDLSSDDGGGDAAERMRVAGGDAWRGVARMGGRWEASSFGALEIGILESVIMHKCMAES